MTTRKYSSRSQQTTLTSAVTSGASSIPVVSTTTLLGGITVSAGQTFTVVIDPDTSLEEIVDVTSVSSPNLIVVRAQDGSTAQDHSAGAIVRHMEIGRDLREANLHIEATGAYNDGTGTHSLHGLGSTDGVVVGTASTSTLTNKTIDATSNTITNIADTNIASGAAIAPSKILGTAVTQADTGTVTGTMIANNTITNTDISNSAAIAATKIAGTAVTQADTGTVTSTMILDGTIVNADINASAAIALSKLATDPLARANHTGTQLASTISNFDTQVRTSRLDQMAAPTTSVSLNTNKLTSVVDPTGAQDAATKNYVDTQISSLVNGAPSTLNQLNELAAAIGNDANYSTTITTALATKLPLAGGTMTGAIAMGTSKITGMGDPTNAQDAATKNYVDTGASSQVAAAATSAASAATSASSAATSASSAATSASSASASATAASSSQTAAATSASSAATSASSAATSASSAAASATTATNSAATATTSAASALTSATSAATSASSAATSASSAAASATTASNSATTASTQASNAAASASAAATSASSASTSASSAATSASSAATSASNASTYASNALTSANSASTSASSAATSASGAATSASSAATSASSSATSATSSASSYTSLDQKYLGAKSSAPTLNNQGGALATGALYWNTTTNAMYSWTGSAWGSISSTADIFRYKYTATGGETSKSGLDDNSLTLSYLVGKEQVYLNGVLLARGADYTATDGSTIASLTALAVSDILEIITFTPYDVSTAINKSTLSAKGSIVTASAAQTPANLPVGTDGYFLQAASTSSVGLQWAAVSGYSAPTVGTTVFTSGATISTIAGLTKITSVAHTSTDANGYDRDIELMNIMGAY
jgi:hypothetical protein